MMLYENMELLNEILKNGGTISDYIEDINREILEFTSDILGCEVSEEDGIFSLDALLRIDTTGVYIYLENLEENEEVIDDILERVERKNDEVDILDLNLRALKDDLEELAVELVDNGF